MTLKIFLEFTCDCTERKSNEVLLLAFTAVPVGPGGNRTGSQVTPGARIPAAICIDICGSLRNQSSDARSAREDGVR